MFLVLCVLPNCHTVMTYSDKLISHTCAFPAMTSRNMCCEKVFSCCCLLLFIFSDPVSLLPLSLQVKVQCQKGIPASLRAKCWPLLCGATDRMKENENLYQARKPNIVAVVIKQEALVVVTSAETVYVSIHLVLNRE